MFVHQRETKLDITKKPHYWEGKTTYYLSFYTGDKSWSFYKKDTVSTASGLKPCSPMAKQECNILQRTKTMTLQQMCLWYSIWGCVGGLVGLAVN